MLQLPQHEVDRQRHLGGRQHLFPQLGENFLQWLILRQTFPEGPEKVGLLDVFFAFQQWHVRIAFLVARLPAPSVRSSRSRVDWRNLQASPARITLDTGSEGLHPELSSSSRKPHPVPGTESTCRTIIRRLVLGR